MSTPEDAPVPMKKVTVTVNTVKYGSRYASTDSFEIEASASEADIEASARELMLDLIEWNFKVEEPTDA